MFFMSNSTVEAQAYCEDVHKINESYQCQFVKETKDCFIEDGFLEYTIFLYCSFSHRLFPLGSFVLVLWLAFLFVALAVAASDFFCPSLIIIAKVLKMSDNIAIVYGITLLAFGNGAPDVFSAIAAVQNMKHGDNGLVFGALLGAGVFLTTVVVGAIAIVRPFRSMERPFLRDIIFYIVTAFFTFYICYDGKVTVYEAVAFIGGYLLYVVIVVVGRVLNQWMKRQNNISINSGDVSEERQQFLDSGNFRPLCTDSDSDEALMTNGINRENEFINSDNFNLPSPEVVVETEELPLISAARLAAHQDSTELSRFLHAISPIDIVGWKNSNLFDKFYAVIKAPALFLFRITIPIVDKHCPLQNWNKYLSILHCPISLLFFIFSANYEYAMYYIGGVFPIYGIFLILGLLLSLLILFTSKSSEPPVYHSVFAFIGFVVAVLWIKTIASEIVNILQTFGVAYNISSAILGLTLLAWGNSIGDFISDLSMARRGYPRAGFSACFGGPLFNTLLGVGIPFTMAAILEPTKAVNISFDPVQIVLFGALTISLVSSLLVIPLCKFNVQRPFGIYLIILYVAFLILAILVEKNVIKINF